MSEFTLIVDKDGNEKRSDELTSQPNNRDFRGAWSLSGSVISEDLDTAKTILKNKIREARKSKFLDLDAAYMKALESNDTSSQSTIVTQKQALRDAPANPAIEAATTVDELKAAWDANLLGAWDQDLPS